MLIPAEPNGIQNVDNCSQNHSFTKRGPISLTKLNSFLNCEEAALNFENRGQPIPNFFGKFAFQKQMSNFFSMKAAKVAN